MKIQGQKEKSQHVICKSWYWILKLEEDDEDAGAAFIKDQEVSEPGTPSLCITGSQQEAILKWDAFPRALSHSWHLSACACVKCLAWRVGAYVSAQRPNCLRSPATCSPLFYPYQPPPSFDWTQFLILHLKAKNAYWDPIWGWGRGREWALSRGEKHSNNTIKRRRGRAEKKKPCEGQFIKCLPSLLFSPSSTSSLSFAVCHFLFAAFLTSFFLYFSLLMLCSLSCWTDWDVPFVRPWCQIKAVVRTRFSA